MRKEDKISVNGIIVTVKELTVAEVRHWMMDMISQEKSDDNRDVVSHVIDQGLFEEIGLSDILRMTDLNKECIDEFAPSELKSIIHKCRELNPDFFGMRRRVIGAASKSA